MVFLICLVCLAAAGAAAWAAMKHKKFRLPLALAAAVCLVPAGFFGLVAVGGGALVNYPGDPAGDAAALFEILGEEQYANAHSRVLGSLGYEGENLSEETADLLTALADCRVVQPEGDCVAGVLTARQTMLVTYVDTEAWLGDLEAAAAAQLQALVQNSPKKELFAEDAEEYLPGVRERAFREAYEAHLAVAGEYLTEARVEVKLLYTPRGWLVLPDAALLSVLSGLDMEKKEPIAATLDGMLTVRKSEIVESLPYIEKVYTLAKEALMGETPDPDGFGVTEDPQEIVKLLESAEKLLEGQNLAWSPDLELKPKSQIRYYLDDTILVLVWQEVHNRTVCTFAEVKVAHGSQFRRVFSGDAFTAYGEPLNWEPPSALSKRTKAVLAISGDFYRFREIGTVVYQGQVLRSETDMMDSCYVDYDGGLHFAYRRELTPETLPDYVADNNINFSISFGPVLVDNGEKVAPTIYAVGQPFEDYDRCALGLLDDLHYLLMTVTRESPYNKAGPLRDVVDYMYDKGCQKAYALDGGATATMMLNGEMVHHRNYKGEKFMSDMLYFATAIPEEER